FGDRGARVRHSGGRRITGGNTSHPRWRAHSRRRYTRRSGDSVIALREAFDPNVFGGKAVQLGEALRAGLPVPDGVALSATWVDRLVSGDSGAVEELRGFLPEVHQPVAVRSSAVGEDSAGASFAGQHATLLHIDPEVDAIVAAVRQVWESGRTDSALAYR